MAITSRKITTYTANIADLSDAPNKDGITPDQLKALFDGRTDAEIKTSINGIVDDLVAITDGASGADQIGITPLKEGGANKIQTAIEELKNDVAANLSGHTSRTDNPHVVTKIQVGLGNVDDAKQATKAEFDTHTARADNPHSVTAAQVGAYTKTEMQTNGSASLHWGNLTNVPNMADSSWKSAVATPANLPIADNTLGDQRVVLNDGDGKQAMYICVATSGDFNAQWDKIGDVDWTNDHGNMVGLGDDDHTQYHNDVRGDIRYYTKTGVDDLLHNRAGAVIKELEIVSSAGQTAYDISATGTYTVGDFTMEVFKKGVTGRYEKLDKDDYVETSGTVVTLTTASSVGDVYLFRWFENTPELISSYAQKNGVLQTNLNAEKVGGVGIANIPTKTTGNLTYYVDPTGNDSNNGTTAVTPFLTVAKAVSMIPQIVNHSIIINIAAGTYAEQLTLQGYSGSGTITVYAGTSLATATSFTIQNIYLLQNSIHITIRGLNFSKTNGNAVRMDNCVSVRVYYCISTVSATAYNGIYVIKSNASIENCQMSNRGSALASDMSNVESQNWTAGAGNTRGLFAEKLGRIVKTGTQPQGDIAEQTLTGGSIV